MVDYDTLYDIQDTVLRIIFEEESEFYLTGGTCISRFYYAKRYSDDLDLFTNFSNTFSFSIKEILQRLKNNNLQYSIETETKDFDKNFRKIIEDIIDEIKNSPANFQ